MTASIADERVSAVEDGPKEHASEEETTLGVCVCVCVC